MWFAIQTRYRFEKKVVAQLGDKGIKTFLPLRNEVHDWSDRSKRIHVPLFPGYAFVRAEPSRLSQLSILQTAGVLGFVGPHGGPARIPDDQIQHLEMVLAQKLPCSLHPFLKAGRRVRIRGGCLDGLEGILSRSGKDYLVISIESIQRSVEVEIKGYELDLI